MGSIKKSVFEYLFFSSCVNIVVRVIEVIVELTGNATTFDSTISLNNDTLNGTEYLMAGIPLAFGSQQTAMTSNEARPRHIQSTSFFSLSLMYTYLVLNRCKAIVFFFAMT